LTNFQEEKQQDKVNTRLFMGPYDK